MNNTQQLFPSDDLLFPETRFNSRETDAPAFRFVLKGGRTGSLRLSGNDLSGQYRLVREKISPGSRKNETEYFLTPEVVHPAAETAEVPDYMNFTYTVVPRQITSGGNDASALRFSGYDAAEPLSRSSQVLPSGSFPVSAGWNAESGISTVFQEYTGGAISSARFFAQSSFSINSDLLNTYGTDAYLVSVSGLSWDSFTLDTTSRYSGGYYYQSRNVIDAEKANYNKPEHAKDANMCWAAAASNVLYWAGWNQHDISLATTDDVFQVFRDNFTLGDRYGGNTQFGAEWYLTGEYNPNGWANWDQCLEDSGGFFKDRVSDASIYVQGSDSDGKTNSFLVDAEEALRAGCGVGLSLGWYTSSGKNRYGGHAITLWGLTYNVNYSKDSLDYYAGIIVTDSDDDDYMDDSSQAPDVMKIMSIKWNTEYGGYVIQDYGGSVTGVIEGVQIVSACPFYEPEYPVKIYSSGTMTSGGSVLSGIEIGSAGNNSMQVSSGGTVYDTRLGSGGEMKISSGGTASGTVMNGGTMNISSAGTAADTAMSGGIMNVYSEAAANGVNIYSDARVAVYNGTVRNAMVRGGTLTAVNAVASSTVLHAGKLNVSSGGSAVQAVLNGGTASIASGGILQDAEIHSGAVLQLAAEAVLLGSHTAGGTISVNGQVNAAGAELNLSISRRKTSDSWIISNLGYLRGAVYSITAPASPAWGTYALAAGAAEFNGTITIRNQAGAAQGSLEIGKTFAAGGILYTLSRSSSGIHSITLAGQQGDLVKIYKSDSLISSGIQINSAVINGSQGDLMHISGGGSAYLTSLGTGGTVQVYSGGQAGGTIMRGGVMNLSGGSAEQTTVSSGTVQVYSGGSAGSTILRGGSLILMSGGSASGTRLSSGSFLLSEQTAAADTFITGGVMTVSDGAAAGKTTVQGGRLDILSGGTVSDTVVSRGGKAVIQSGGSAFGTVVNSGNVIVSGGYDSGAIIFGIGSQTVSGSGIVTGANVYGNGRLFVEYAGLAENVRLGSAGRMFVSSGGTAAGTLAAESGYLNILSGGNAVSAQLRQGSMIVSAGGSAFDAVVSAGGSMRVFSGYAENTAVENGGFFSAYCGLLKNVTVHSGGELRLSGTNTLQGTLYVAGTLSAAENVSADGVYLAMSLNGRRTDDPYIVSDPGKFSGANFAVSVSASQSAGTYQLAKNAADFSKALTVQLEDGTYLGTLSCGGQLSYGKYTYSLAQTDGTLTFTVAADTQGSYRKGDLTGKGTPDIIMVNPAASDAGAWLLDAKGNASWLGLSGLPGTWELFDTGNANGDIYSDVFLYDAANKDIGVWTMNEHGVPGWESWGRLESDCDLIATRDFNGDGLTDLLYRRSNGVIGAYMNQTGEHFEVPLPLDWNMVGVGDINGDGTADLILRNGNSIGAWLMSANGPSWQGLADVGADNQIVGLGDFNGDGTADILFNSNGSYGAWLMKDGGIAGWKAFCDFPTSMVVEAIGDYNGDGIDDLRVRNGNDLAAVMVYTDGLEWKNFGSVPSDWKTSLAGPV